jgi:thiamine pyrophosphokinase
MLTVIVANGAWADHPDLANLLARSSLILAVDGGANHCSRLGILPDALIGDLDSIDPAVLEEFTKKAVLTHRYPRHKDATDLQLALDMAVGKGAREICLLAALGGRWDMSLSNLLLLAQEKYKSLRCTVPGPDCLIYLLHSGEPFTLEGTIGDKVSLIPLHGDVHGITLQGFQYPLENTTLAFGSTRGISNVLENPTATVQLQSGVLLCVRLYSP